MTENKGRLLSDEEIRGELKKYFTEDEMLIPEPYFTIVTGIIAVVRQAQRDLTASEKDAEHKKVVGENYLIPKDLYWKIKAILKQL